MKKEGRSLMEEENVIPRLEEIEKKQEEFETEQQKQTEQIKKLSTQMVGINEGQLTMHNKIQSVEMLVSKDGNQTRELLGTVVKHILNNSDNHNKRKYSFAEKAVGTLFGAGGLAGLITAIAVIWN